MNVCMPLMSVSRRSECPCQKRRAGRARPMTCGEVNSTVYAVRLVSRWVDLSASCSPLIGAVKWMSRGSIENSYLGIWTFALTFRREGFCQYWQVPFLPSGAVRSRGPARRAPGGDLPRTASHGQPACSSVPHLVCNRRIAVRCGCLQFGCFSRGQNLVVNPSI